MQEPKTNPKDNPSDTNKSILKISTCDTLTGKATLGYQLALDGKQSIHIRITANNGGGFFSDEWIALEAIREAFKSCADDTRISASELSGLFKGKSVNTPAFILAVLKAEGFIKPIGELKRYHQCLDAKSFKALIKKLQKLA